MPPELRKRARDAHRLTGACKRRIVPSAVLLFVAAVAPARSGRRRAPERRSDCCGGSVLAGMRLAPWTGCFLTRISLLPISGNWRKESDDGLLTRQ